MALLLTRPDDTPLVGTPQTVTGATNADPIVMTVVAHGFENGDFVLQASVGGNTAANGTFKVANKTANTYELTDSADVDVAGNGAYTSGGTAKRILYFPLERGVPSPVQPVKIKNDGAFTVAGAYVTPSVRRAPAGSHIATGDPVLDERMGRFQITSVDSSGTVGQTAGNTGVQVMGTNAVALLPPILPGNSIFADVWMAQAAASANGGAADAKLEISNVATAFPLPLGVSEVATGVLTEVGSPYSMLEAGRVTTSTGTPDATVHTSAGSWLLAGSRYSDATIRDTTFNQNDGAATALTAGQKYIAALTQSATNQPTVTKGLRATTPVKPTPPAGEILLAWITVAYSAGATVIAAADIENVNDYGRLLVTAPASGLSVTVYPGRAIALDFMQVHSVKETLSVTASTTNYVWYSVAGIVSVTTSATPPSPGAHLLADAVTNGSSVTALTDRRTFLARAGVVTATGTATLVAGTVTVNHPDVKATSRIVATIKTVGGTPGIPTVPTRTVGTSFVITSTNAADTSSLDWALMNG
ncbi:MAG: hypothetical protein M3547_01385 [Acidobacteriota bacterium]|nr:hypothetical protein [Acidobacteriota bacterium]